MLNDDKVSPIFDKYRNELKPLIAEYEARNEQFVTPLLGDLAFLLDNVALYYTFPNTDERNILINEANEDLTRCVRNVEGSILSSQIMMLKSFEKTFSKNVLTRCCDGHFIGKYEFLKQEAKNNDVHVCYCKMKEIEKLIDDSNESILTNNLTEDSWKMIVLKYVLSIFISLIVTLFFAWII